MTTKNKDIIKKHLPKDYAKAVKKLTGYSPSMTRMVKNGDRYNEDIEDALLFLALENKRKKDDRKKRIAKLNA